MYLLALRLHDNGRSVDPFWGQGSGVSKRKGNEHRARARRRERAEAFPPPTFSLAQHVHLKALEQPLIVILKSTTPTYSPPPLPVASALPLAVSMANNPQPSFASSRPAAAPEQKPSLPHPGPRFAALSTSIGPSQAQGVGRRGLGILVGAYPAVKAAEQAVSSHLQQSGRAIAEQCIVEDDRCRYFCSGRASAEGERCLWEATARRESRLDGQWWVLDRDESHLLHEQSCLRAGGGMERLEGRSPEREPLQLGGLSAAISEFR